MWSWEAWLALAIALFAVVLAVLAQWDKFEAPQPRTRRLGYVAAGLGALAALAQFGLQLRGMVREAEAQREVAMLEAFRRGQQLEVDEASGAAEVGSFVHVADDEEPKVFRYAMGADGTWAQRGSGYEIRDARSGRPEDPPPARCGYRVPAAASADSPASAGNSEGKRIPPEVVNKVDDIEAAAQYGGNLYLVTSHSLTKKGERLAKRDLLLKIDRFDEIERKAGIAWVAHATSLRKAIDDALRQLLTEGELIDPDEDCVNVEGFAVDDQGTAYIGLRSPVLKRGMQSYAIVLHGNLDALMGQQGTLQSHLLKLSHTDDAYGITSLDWVAPELLILGNSSSKFEQLTPRLWRWAPTDLQLLEHTPHVVDTWSLPLPATFQAKPEAIVVPAASSNALVFLDALGHGGLHPTAKAAIGVLVPSTGSANAPAAPQNSAQSMAVR